MWNWIGLVLYTHPRDGKMANRSFPDIVLVFQLILFLMQRKSVETKKSFSFDVTLCFCKFSEITRKSQLTLNLHVSSSTRHTVLSRRAKRVCISTAAPPVDCATQRCRSIHWEYEYHLIVEKILSFSSLNRTTRCLLFSCSVAHSMVRRKRDQWPPYPSTHWKTTRRIVRRFVKLIFEFWNSLNIEYRWIAFTLPFF